MLTSLLNTSLKKKSVFFFVVYDFLFLLHVHGSVLGVLEYDPMSSFIQILFHCMIFPFLFILISFLFCRFGFWSLFVFLPGLCTCSLSEDSLLSLLYSVFLRMIQRIGVLNAPLTRQGTTECRISNVLPINFHASDSYSISLNLLY